MHDVIKSDHLVACSDFNCNGDSSTSVLTDLQTVFDARDLPQFVQSPTRRTTDVSNLLDLVIGRNGFSCISNVAVQPPHHASDHDIVMWTLSTRLKPTRQLVKCKFRSLKNVDWTSFQADVSSSELYASSANNVDEFADQLDTVITDIMDHSESGKGSCLHAMTIAGCRTKLSMRKDNDASLREDG